MLILFIYLKSNSDFIAVGLYIYTLYIYIYKVYIYFIYT